ncbi:O-antigen ligase family protein [Micromonospora sp. WMMA1923]|uniref:O-antigen ligase family protein n=1 Tax=Micromonospora sp. WMMA1923 TaxID=3404125 RepID=UPI003B9424AB
MPDSGELVSLLVLVGILVPLLCLIPVNAVVVLWGAVLPIYATSGVQTQFFDAARVGCAVVVLLRTRPSGTTTGWRNARSWLFLVGLLGCYVAVVGLLHGDTKTPTLGVSMVCSVLVAAVAARRAGLGGQILLGYAIGVCCSASVVLLQALDLPNPARSMKFNGRLWGLGSNAPRVSLQLAIGCVLLLVRGLGAKPVIQLAAFSGMAVCFSALLAVGGREGIAALACALVVIMCQRLLRWWQLVTGAGVLAAAAVVISAVGIEMTTIDRFSDPYMGSEPGSGDFTTGRAALLGESLTAFSRHWLFGIGTDQFQILYNYSGRFHGATTPHVAPLTFAVAAGIVGGAIATYLFFRLAHLVFTSTTRPGDARTATAGAVGAALLVSALLEPTGPFQGVELTVLSVLAVTVLSERLAARGTPRGRSHRLPAVPVAGVQRAPMPSQALGERGTLLYPKR